MNSEKITWSIEYKMELIHLKGDDKLKQIQKDIEAYILGLPYKYDNLKIVSNTSKLLGLEKVISDTWEDAKEELLLNLNNADNSIINYYEKIKPYTYLFDIVTIKNIDSIDCNISSKRYIVFPNDTKTKYMVMTKYEYDMVRCN